MASLFSSEAHDEMTERDGSLIDFGDGEVRTITKMAGIKNWL